jgi:hypothetical protein
VNPSPSLPDVLVSVLFSGLEKAIPVVERCSRGPRKIGFGEMGRAWDGRGRLWEGLRVVERESLVLGWPWVVVVEFVLLIGTADWLVVEVVLTVIALTSPLKFGL